MGCTLSQPEMWQMHELQAMMTPGCGGYIFTLPKIEQVSAHQPNILRLKGDGWVFNPTAPDNLSILQGISSRDLQQMIQALNMATARVMATQTKQFPISLRHVRNMQYKHAVLVEIEKINMNKALSKGCIWAADLSIEGEVAQHQGGVTAYHNPCVIYVTLPKQAPVNPPQVAVPAMTATAIPMAVVAEPPAAKIASAPFA